MKKEKNVKRIIYSILGFTFLLSGFIYLLNSITGITGFIIIDEISRPLNGLISIWLITGGIAFLYAAKKRKRKGQAAMEFFTTYGWAILAGIMVIGIMAFSGAFDNKRFSPYEAQINPPFSISGWDVDETTSRIEVRNDGGRSYIINNIDISFYKFKKKSPVTRYFNCVLALMFRNFKVSRVNENGHQIYDP